MINIGACNKMEEFEVDNKMLKVLKIHVNNDKNMDLIVAAGFSDSSFEGTSNIIMKSEHIAFLKNKYRDIYIINYSSYKEDQKKACEIRDKKIERDVKDKIDIYKSENNLNIKIAKIFHKLITKKLHLKDNIELLGKCAGAGIMLELTNFNSKLYNTLYFGVPGIPFSVEKLFNYSKQRLSKMKFIFGWVKQDEYVYNWGVKSCDEKERYESVMRLLEKEKKIKINYKCIMEDLNGKSGDSKKYHEISPLLIQYISDII